MKFRTLACSVFAFALCPFSNLRADAGFTPIDLAPQANFKLNAEKKSRTGHVVLKGVPFELPASRAALQTEGQSAKGPTSFRIPVSVPRPTEVNILLQGGYVKREFSGKKVGEVVLEFKDGKQQVYPITAWKTLRETWAYNTEIVPPDSTGNPKLINVYAEPENRGKPATAFLDMFVIHLEQVGLTAELTAIEIRDLSKETVQDISPSLIISGISVKHD
ncbi:MAG TPA: hypothetical protein VK961_24675 [Chthoniobacter sp.]|nr:hypothetical protein [Chthoniobacter sp.]